LEDVRANARDGERIKIVIIGNKIDLLTPNLKEQVSEQAARDFAKKNNCQFILASAKDRVNVTKALNDALGGLEES